MEAGDLLPLERFAEKSADNLVNAIQANKKISLARFLYALGIIHVGEETARLFAEQVPGRITNHESRITPKNILKIFDFSLADLQEIQASARKWRKAFMIISILHTRKSFCGN